MVKRMTSAQIRRAFLDYFKRNAHTEVPSSSLIPGDPTLLFTNAGMVQFKDTFLGLEKRAYLRVTTAQKSMRVSGKHNDLENVGPSPRHHTFFEMLGNFSFGDYFKRDAIRFAYELLTQVYGLPPDRLAYTVYENDDEAYNVWVNEIGVDPRRVARMGAKTNFWQMADTGPCGPTSEIHWDIHPELGVDSIIPLVQAEDDRFLELWNLVFMQFNRKQTPDGFVDEPLPKPGVDTGMGLERISAVVQNVPSNYDTDLFMPIMDAIQEILHHDDTTREKNYIAYRVIADHGRAMTFLLADGVLPGNEGATYVLRMVMRRAMRFAKMMGVDRPFLGEVARAIVHEMSSHYTELSAKQDFIIKAIAQEEERFRQTLENGLTILDDITVDLQARGEAIIPGDAVFRLWDTYGFPIDLTRDVAHERGLTLDEDGFRTAMERQRKQSQAAGKFTFGEQQDVYRALNLPETKFLGYTTTRASGTLIAILRDGESVEQARVGDTIELVLDQTPFYAESGGQVGDTGVIETLHGAAASLQNAVVQIVDTQKPVAGLIAHRGRVVSGALRVGDTVSARVDEQRCADIMRNHTATHLLHKALHEILGPHATQKGSLVAPDRLRFDFNHLAPITREELQTIESRVNDMILRNLPVHWYVTTKAEAMRAGAMALFGEKYGDEVRVVCVADRPLSENQRANQPTPQLPDCYSRELCGGTHLDSTGQIGLFLILSESSVGAGLRRIEALSGRGAQQFVRERLSLLNDLSAQLGAPPEQVVKRLKALQDELDARKKELGQLQRASAKSDLDSLLGRAQRVEGVSVIAEAVNAASADVLREMSDALRDKLGSGVVALGAVINDKPSLIVSITPDLIARGLRAGDLIKQPARLMGGSGGGRPNMAQAGGKDAAKLGDVLSLIPSVIENTLKGHNGD